MHFTTYTAAETEGLAGELARARPRDARELTVLYLQGDLGTGKTTFARGFLRALGETEPVRSPSYTLFDLHELGDLTVLHIDLYRLREEGELESLGLRDWARPGALWLIEWPDRARKRLPQADLKLAFTVSPPAHEIDLTAGTAFGRVWLQAFSAPG